MLEELKLLDVEDASSWEEVRKAYYQQVKVWHPDRFANDPDLQKRAKRKTQEINLAYERLQLQRQQEAEHQARNSFDVYVSPQYGGPSNRTYYHQPVYEQERLVSMSRQRAFQSFGSYRTVSGTCCWLKTTFFAVSAACLTVVLFILVVNMLVLLQNNSASASIKSDAPSVSLSQQSKTLPTSRIAVSHQATTNRSSMQELGGGFEEVLRRRGRSGI